MYLGPTFRQRESTGVCFESGVAAAEIDPVKMEEDKKPGDHVNLKIRGQDGNEVFMRIKNNVQLDKLMTAYCDSQSLYLNSTAFLLDGRRLRAEQTPDELKMEDGDEIDALPQQNHAGGFMNYGFVNMHNYY